MMIFMMIFVMFESRPRSTRYSTTRSPPRKALALLVKEQRTSPAMMWAEGCLFICPTDSINFSKARCRDCSTCIAKKRVTARVTSYLAS